MTTNRSAFAEPRETSRGRQPLRRTGSKRTRIKGADRSQRRLSYEATGSANPENLFGAAREARL